MKRESSLRLDILLPLQDHFSKTDLGRERASLFVYTILSIIVVLNPVQANMVMSVEDWIWSSYNAMVKSETKNQWLDIDWMLSQFDQSRKVHIFRNKEIRSESCWFIKEFIASYDLNFSYFFTALLTVI
jgi:hypothetical protein